MKSFLTFAKKNKVLLGWIWGIVTTCLSIYLTIWPIEQNPQLTFYQKQKFDVFTLDKPIDELQILLNGEDIRKNGSNLKVYKLKIINEGKKDIKNTDYSNELPFGIHVDNGKIVRLNVDNATDSQIGNNLIAGESKDSTLINLNKIFIRKGDYALFDVWILHNNKIEPVLKAIGNIADTKIIMSTGDEAQKTDWRRLLILLLVIGGLLLLARVLDYFAPIDFLTRQIRLLQIKRTYGQHYDEANKNRRVMAKIFSQLGKKRFANTIAILKDREKGNALYSEECNNKTIVDKYFQLSKTDKIPKDNKLEDSSYSSDILLVTDLLCNAGLAEVNTDTFRITESFLQEIDLVVTLI